MIREAFLAGLIALCAAPVRAAGDPAAVAAVEAFLREDEKALLAALLVDRAASVEFNADVKFAAGDARNMKLVLDKWRGRMVAFADSEVRVATPDLEGVYRDSGALMAPPTRAYLLRSLRTMTEGDRNTLLAYLEEVDNALASNGGKLTWYTKKVVSGIYDKHRKILGAYLAHPLARDARGAAPAAGLALAEKRRAAEAVPAALPPSAITPPASPPPTVRRAPVAPPSAGTPPAGTPPAGSTGAVRVPPPSSALEQARRAAEAAERAGPGFDGGGAVPPASVVVAPGSGQPALAPPAAPAGVPTLIAEVPSPVEPEDDFRASLRDMKTGKTPAQPRHYLPGGLGGLLGGILGFLLGGPIGAAIGIGIGVAAGRFAGRKLFK